MSDCIDKRFERMLHAYELGMLDPEQRTEMETHLLECDHCFEKAQKMADASELMRGSDRVKEVVTASASAIGEPQSSSPEQRITVVRRWLPRLVPVAAALFILLLLKDWKLEFRPSDEVRAEADRVVVVPFDNAADPADSSGLAKIASHLLSTDLSESDYIRVISSRRLTDLISIQGLNPDSALDFDQTTRLAGEAGARWMLTGRILQQAPRIIIGTELSEVRSGTLLGSQTVTGTDDESIFELIDQLTVQIKTALALPIEALREDDPKIADVTTHSAQAYRYYLQGLDYYEKYYADDARRSFETALSFDSTFAMAYYWLARIVDADLLEKAVQYSRDATEKERGYILSLQDIANQDYRGAINRLQLVTEKYPDEKEAFFWMGRYYFILQEYDSALVNLQQAVAIDPLHKKTYNQLAYLHKARGDFDLALQSIDRYIELAPTEANPHDSRGEILAEAGRLDEAIASYQRALDIKPDFWSSLHRLGILLLHRGDYEAADSCFSALASCPNRSQRSAGRLFLAYRPIHQGRFSEALRRLDESLAGDRIENIPWTSRMSKLLLKVHVLAETGELEQALAELMRGRAAVDSALTEPSLSYHYHTVELLLALDRPDEARAAADSLQAGVSEHVNGSSYSTHAAGALAMHNNQPDSAAALFRQCFEYVGAPPSQYRLAEALEAAGSLEQAIGELEDYTSRYTSLRAFWSMYNVKVHYRLGCLYESSERFDEAIVHYRRFLAYWENAEGLDEMIAEASERLRRLQSRP